MSMGILYIYIYTSFIQTCLSEGVTTALVLTWWVVGELFQNMVNHMNLFFEVADEGSERSKVLNVKHILIRDIY